MFFSYRGNLSRTTRTHPWACAYSPCTCRPGSGLLCVPHAHHLFGVATLFHCCFPQSKRPSLDAFFNTVPDAFQLRVTSFTHSLTSVTASKSVAGPTAEAHHSKVALLAFLLHTSLMSADLGSFNPLWLFFLQSHFFIKFRCLW